MTGDDIRELFDLTSRVAVITGGAGLLGYQHAEAIAMAGGSPVLVDLPSAEPESKADQLRQGFGVEAWGYSTDITQPDQVRALLDSVVGRITVMNRTFEAGTMDLMAFIPDGWRENGDPQTAELLDAIAADEIHHVRFANHWVHKLCAENKRNLFKVAQAVSFMDAAQKALTPAAGSTNLVGVSVEDLSQSAPINVADRQLADFTDDGIYPPEWVNGIGKPAPGQAYRGWDTFGDHEAVLVTFSIL